jgi:energy-coupling factor transporter transmembrane protein EcfT
MLANLDSPIFLVVLGVFFIFAAILGMSGRWKRWYWTSPRLVYLYLPIGILFLLATLGYWVKGGALSTVLQGAEFVMLGIAIWWVARPPDFLKPTWIRTIEAHPKAVYVAMAAAVKKGDEWHPKVQDPESLNQWIRTLEKKTPKTARRK